MDKWWARFPNKQTGHKWKRRLTRSFPNKTENETATMDKETESTDIDHGNPLYVPKVQT